MDKKKLIILISSVLLILLVISFSIVFIFSGSKDQKVIDDNTKYKEIEDVDEFEDEMSLLEINESRPLSEEYNKTVEDIEKAKKENEKEEEKEVVVTENKEENKITTKTSEGIDVTVNKPIEVPKDKEGNYVAVPTDPEYISAAVERSISRDTKENTNLYKSAKEFIKEKYDYTSFTEGSGESLMVYNKDNRESVFTASLRSKEVAQKLVDDGDLPFLTTLTLIFSDKNLEGNEEYYADLMISMGYELTKEEIIENLNKVNKLKIYESFDYKNNKFSIGFGNKITVDKLY